MIRRVRRTFRYLRSERMRSRRRGAVVVSRVVASLVGLNARRCVGRHGFLGLSEATRSRVPARGRLCLGRASDTSSNVGAVQETIGV